MTRAVPPLRSKLFVPGNRGDWMDGAHRFGADALVLDLEDSVPEHLKEEGRRVTGDFISRRGGDTVLFVRINDLNSGKALADLHAVVRPGLGGILLPKTESADDVRFLSRLLGWLEADAGMEAGSTLINPSIETAAGIRHAYEIGCASERVAYMGGIGVGGGDEARSVGFRWSPGGKETFTIRSQVLLDARAAGVPNPMMGLWNDITDLDGLRAFAEEGRDLGYDGMVVIYPGHVPVVNEVFSPSEEEIRYYRELLEAMAQAEAEGSSATVFEGVMVDTAMVKTAHEKLALAEATPPAT